jgi:EKC/KEOPS complex subunit CGI121/TPRKB
VRKIYKLNSAGGGGKNSKSEVSGLNGVNGSGKEVRDLEVAVLGAMALRGVTN